MPDDIESKPPERLADGDWPNYGAAVASVLRISEDRKNAVLEVDGQLKSFPQRVELPFAEGQTVVLDERGEPGAVLTETPVDRLGLGRDKERMNPADLMIKPDSINIDLSDFGGSRALVKRATELVRVALDPEKQLKKLGVNPVKGILFSGPSGTGKTHLARALSRSVRANFYLVDGPEIINKWVGESEQRLRDLFTHAEENAPAILFFDELDSIVSSRGPDAPEHATRFVGQFLTALDGFDASGEVLVIAATNLPGALDSALLRPGRLSFKLEFSAYPSSDDRLAILQASARHVQGQENADLPALVNATEGWSAAELAMIWTEAGIAAVTDRRTNLCAEDIAAGLERSARNREVSRRQVQGS
ncbi:MAG: ATP-binding protein [Nocardioides sp.]